MKSETLQIVCGSGNVFRDFGHANPDVEQLKAIFATEIIKMLDREGLTVRTAHARTGIAAADFSRIRNANLGRFTLDRLISTINRLGSRVEVKVKIPAFLTKVERLGFFRLGIAFGFPLSTTPAAGISWLSISGSRKKGEQLEAS